MTGTKLCPKCEGTGRHKEIQEIVVTTILTLGFSAIMGPDEPDHCIICNGTGIDPATGE